MAKTTSHKAHKSCQPSKKDSPKIAPKKEKKKKKANPSKSTTSEVESLTVKQLYNKIYYAN